MDTDPAQAADRVTPPAEPPPSLRRSRSHRMLAGVAGGLAERFDVDVALVRVAFVVLAFAWGAGVVLYAALWALVPGAPASVDGVATDDEALPTSPWLTVLLFAGIVAFGVLVVSPWWGGPRVGGLVSLLWFALLVGLLLTALRGPARGVSLGRVLGVLTVACLTVVILVLGAFLALVAWTGVPLSGGIGDRVYQPATLAQVRTTYRTAIGDLTVDLRRVRFSGPPRHVTATVAVGVVTVEVPPGVVVDVNAHSGVGTVVATPGDLQQFGTPSTSSAARPQLVLTAEAGVGQVRLVRGPPR